MSSSSSVKNSILKKIREDSEYLQLLPNLFNSAIKNILTEVSRILYSTFPLYIDQNFNINLSSIKSAMNLFAILFVTEVAGLQKLSDRRRLNALRKYSAVKDSMDHHFEAWNPFHKPKTRRYPYMKKTKKKPKIIRNREIHPFGLNGIRSHLRNFVGPFIQ